MDELLQAVGIPTVDFPLKTKCCGGSLTGTTLAVGIRLNYILLKEAVRKGAQAIVTVCGLCQFNLDAYQSEIRGEAHELYNIPVFYLPQVLGWQLGGDFCALGLSQGNLGQTSYQAVVLCSERGRDICLKIMIWLGLDFISHCGSNIAGIVDVKSVAEYVATLPGVVISRDYKYMCSDPEQVLIVQDIEENQLNRIVVASCSPLLHEHTFRKAVVRAGLNPYFIQMVNIREHDSWVHSDKGKATAKAKDLARAAIRRVVSRKALEEKRVPIHPKVLVLGGGIAGIHAALHWRMQGTFLSSRARAQHWRAHGEI